MTEELERMFQDENLREKFSKLEEEFNALCKKKEKLEMASADQKEICFLQERIDCLQGKMYNIISLV